MNPLRRKYERYVLFAVLLSCGVHLLLAFTPESFGARIFGLDSRTRRPLPRLEVIELAPEPAPEYVEQRSVNPGGGESNFIAPPPPALRLSESSGDSNPKFPIALPSEPGLPSLDDLPLAPAVPDEGTDPPGQDSTLALDAYLAAVFARIESERRYPETSRRMGQQGEVGLSFAIARDGSLAEEITLISPCRFSTLNRSAVESLRRCSPFPPLPQYVLQERLNLTVRILFHLSD